MYVRGEYSTILNNDSIIIQEYLVLKDYKLNKKNTLLQNKINISLNVLFS